MKVINKYPILTVSMFFIILMLSNNSLFAYISFNGSGSGYNDTNTGSDLTKNTASIDSLITESASCYLQGKADIQTLLNLVELQDVRGVDYTELQRLIASAVEHITNARLAYEKLVVTAKRTPYNPAVIEQLKDFDYNSFMLENRLNETIFKKVEGYLSNGDITGAFRHGLSVIRSIQWLLFIVANYVEFDQMPELEISWKLNELCAEFSLFGSYTARIFHSI
jgi:hypothetical protein